MWLLECSDLSNCSLVHFRNCLSSSLKLRLRLSELLISDSFHDLFLLSRESFGGLGSRALRGVSKVNVAGRDSSAGGAKSIFSRWRGSSCRFLCFADGRNTLFGAATGSSGNSSLLHLLGRSRRAVLRFHSTHIDMNVSRSARMMTFIGDNLGRGMVGRGGNDCGSVTPLDLCHGSLR